MVCAVKYRLRNVTRGTLLGDAVDLADTVAKRRTGLLKHTGLRAGEGLWIAPCESVHTFFMKFALDLVYLDRKHIVRKTVSNVPPWRMSMCVLAHSIVELPAHSIELSDTRKGDQLVFDPAVGA
jgi:uncharacterized protein